jgi:hypothetical protein
MKHLTVTVLVLLLICGVNLYAQGQFGIYGLLSLPSGDFADDNMDDEKSGLAKTGFGAGAAYTFPLGTEGLGWETDVAVIFNGVDESALEEEEVSVSAGQWMNIPIMTGLRYTSDMSPTMQFFALGQICLTFVNGPDIEVTDEFYDESYEYQIGSGNSFGFGVGAGLIFNSKFVISFRYLALGSTDLEISIDGEEIEDAGYEPSISMMVITAGINF